jgi:uncharacterized XkdX family phage protein
MDWFGIASRYYIAGYYQKEEIAVFVARGKITEAQYQEITGEPL